MIVRTEYSYVFIHSHPSWNGSENSGNGTTLKSKEGKNSSISFKNGTENDIALRAARRILHRAAKKVQGMRSRIPMKHSKRAPFHADRLNAVHIATTAIREAEQEAWSGKENAYRPILFRLRIVPPRAPTGQQAENT